MHKHIKETDIENFIQQLDKEFDLVMITEQFEESLILFKELTCMTYQDIAYIKKHVSKRQSSQVSELSRIKLKMYLKYEYKVYNYFKQKLETKLASYGKLNMMISKQKMHKAQEEFIHACRGQCNNTSSCGFVQPNNSYKTTPINCPCKAQFDFCMNCLASKVGSDRVMNIWASCIQEKRLQMQNNIMRGKFMLKVKTRHDLELSGNRH